MSRETILKLVKVNHDRLRKLSVRELGSFGSYARGDARPDSDVDFFVDHEEKSFDRYMMLGHARPAANSITFRVAVHRSQHQRALSKSIDQYVGPIVQWTIRLYAWCLYESETRNEGSRDSGTLDASESNRSELNEYRAAIERTSHQAADAA